MSGCAGSYAPLQAFCSCRAGLLSECDAQLLSAAASLAVDPGPEAYGLRLLPHVAQ